MSEMKDASRFLAEVKKVCPVVGANTDGRIDFAPEATEQQKSAAREVAVSFDWAKEAPKPIAPLTDDEIRWVRDQMKAKVDALR